MSEIRYFPTVDRCNTGRGIFCNRNGQTFSSDKPHTQEELQEKIGPFWLIMSPQSEGLTAEQLKEYNYWIPLAEYSNEWGIARKIDNQNG